MQTGAPITTVEMNGTREAQPIGQVNPNFLMPITVRVGKPLVYQHFADQPDDPLILRSITDEVMYELRELSDQDYVNTYAKRKDTDDSAAAETAKVA